MVAHAGFRNLLAVKKVLPALRKHQAVEQLQQRGLSRAIRPLKQHRRTGRNRKVHRAQYRLRTIGIPYISAFYHPITPST